MTRDAWSKKRDELAAKAVARKEHKADWNTRVAAEWNGNIEPVSLRREPTAGIHPIISQCRLARMAEPVAEFRFAHPRRWRFDYCWPTQMLALEIEGGLWTNGRHSRGSGAIADLEKYSEAAIRGYRILYATPQEVEQGVALDRIERALNPPLRAA